jgi:hypothetical protein
LTPSDPPPDEIESGDDEPLDGPEFRPPEWAFAINFFWPGAGLIYLRKPLVGVLNFIIVVALAAAIWIALPDAKREKVAPWVGLILCGASGIWAYSAAQDFNDRREREFDAQHKDQEPGAGGS